MTPEDLQRIGRLYLRGASYRDIGDAVGIHFTTVQHHLNHSIKPLWRDETVVQRDAELAKVNELYRTAWGKFVESEQPEHRSQMKKALLEDGTEPELVETVLTRVRRTGEQGWLEVVKWCLDYRARVVGLYAPTRHQVEGVGSFRVAGQTPDEFDADTVSEIMRRIEERRVYQAAVRAHEQN